MPNVGNMPYKMQHSGVPSIAVPESLEISVRDFQYRSWQKPLQEAIDETDLEQLPEKLSAAEGAIFVRLPELGVLSDGHKKSEAIRHACEELLKIQTQRLKWPVPNGILSDCAE
jgi:hypothetical protein